MKKFKIDTARYSADTLSKVNCLIQGIIKELGYDCLLEDFNAYFNKAMQEQSCYEVSSRGISKLPNRVKFEVGKLYCSQDLIVLCTGEGSENTFNCFRGCVVSSKGYMLGYESGGWQQSSFKPFTGTIENGKIKI